MNNLGIYYLAYRVVFVPVTIVSESVANAFWGEISQIAKADLKDALKFYFRWSARLAVLGFAIGLIISFGSEFVYILFDRKDWAGLDKVMVAMVPALLGTLIFSSTNHFIVYDKQHYQLYADLITLVSLVFSITLAGAFTLSFLDAIWLLSFASLCSYIARFFLHILANIQARQG